MWRINNDTLLSLCVVLRAPVSYLAASFLFLVQFRVICIWSVCRLAMRTIYVLSVFFFCSCTNYLFIIICSIKKFVQVTCTHFQTECLRRLMKLLTYALFHECHDIYLRTFLSSLPAPCFYVPVFCSRFNLHVTALDWVTGNRSTFNTKKKNLYLYIEEAKEKFEAGAEKVNLHFFTLSFVYHI